MGLSFTPCGIMPDTTVVVNIELFGFVYDEMLRDANVTFTSVTDATPGSPRSSMSTETVVLSTRLASRDHTDANTLVSLPAIARAGTVSSWHPRARAREPTPPRDVQLRMGHSRRRLQCSLRDR